MLTQPPKDTRQLPVEKKVLWPAVLVFENFPEGIMISEYARIRILALRVRWKMASSGANLVSDGKVDPPPRNSGCALAGFYGAFNYPCVI